MLAATRSAMARTGGWRVMRSGPAHPRWSGRKVTYSGLHDWVRYHKGPATICVECGASKSVAWANISGRYLRKLSDYRSLCVICHRQYDAQPFMRGASVKRFGGAD